MVTRAHVQNICTHMCAHAHPHSVRNRKPLIIAIDIIIITNIKRAALLFDFSMVM